MTHSIVNFLIERVIFPLGDKLFKSSFTSKLKSVRDLSQLGETELENLQNEKLRAIIEHATKNCKYYQEIQWDKNRHITDVLKDFPILTKAKLRNAGVSLLTKPASDCIAYETSGSSGIATKVFVDNNEESLFRAILINWWEWTGYYLGKPILQTGMTNSRGLLKSIKDWVTNTIYINAFDLREEKVLPVLRKLENMRNYHLGGYAASLYVIAQIAERNELEIKFDAVISWGDKMFPHYKHKIEKVFSTKVFENYACNEGIMIGQKIDLPYYYIYSPNVYLEILDDNGSSVSDGEIGRVVVTKLDGYAMPLIRYDVGDLAVKLPQEKYPSKRKFNFPLLEKVIGRDTDIIKTPEGNSLIVHTFTGIFEFYTAIQQFRIIQSNIDAITIEYIVSDGFRTDLLQTIENEIREKCKTSMLIQWKRVNEIPPTKSGKPQIIINDLIRLRDQQA